MNESSSHFDDGQREVELTELDYHTLVCESIKKLRYPIDYRLTVHENELSMPKAICDTLTITGDNNIVKGMIVLVQCNIGGRNNTVEVYGAVGVMANSTGDNNIVNVIPCTWEEIAQQLGLA